MIPESENNILHIGRYHYETGSRKLSLDSTVTRLTSMQAKILKYFAENANQVIPRAEIVTAVWGDYDYFKGRSMDVAISHLRRYLKGDPSVQIQNIFGIGFSLITSKEEKI